MLPTPLRCHLQVLIEIVEIFNMLGNYIGIDKKEAEHVQEKSAVE